MVRADPNATLYRNVVPVAVQRRAKRRVAGTRDVLLDLDARLVARERNEVELWRTGGILTEWLSSPPSGVRPASCWSR